MKRVALFLLVAASPLAMLACPKPPQPGPVFPPDADAAPAPPLDASVSCATACATLAQFGCSTGTSPHCLEALELLDQQGLKKTPTGAALTCAMIAMATSAAQVQALGGSSLCGGP